MNEQTISFFVYLLKVSLIIGAFTLLYYSLFRKLTFYMMNRVVIVLAVFAAFIIPLVQVDVEESGPVRSIKAVETKIQEQFLAEVIAETQDQVVQGEPLSTSETENETFLWEWNLSLLLIFYLGICSILLFRAGFGIWRVLRLKRVASRVRGNTFSYFLCSSRQPFSFFNWIFVSELDPPKFILEHEAIHGRYWHSLDVLFFELLKCLLWFNPFIYLLTKLSRVNNEYFTDSVVAGKHHVKPYTDLLLSVFTLSQGSGFEKVAVPITNSFAMGSLKHRIRQLIKKPTNTIGKSAYLSYLPFLLLFVVLFSCRVEEDLFAEGIGRVVTGIYHDEYGDQPQQEGKLIAKVNYDVEGRVLKNDKFSLGSKEPNQIALFFPFIQWGKEVSVLNFGKEWPEVHQRNVKSKIEFWEDFYESGGVRYIEDGLERFKIVSPKGVDLTQDLENEFYEYDQSGNIVKIIEKRIVSERLWKMGEQKSGSKNALLIKELSELKKKGYLEIVYEFEYDKLNRMISSRHDGFPLHKRFTYDEYGRLSGIAVLRNGKVLRSFEISYEGDTEKIKQVMALNGQKEAEYSIEYEYRER